MPTVRNQHGTFEAKGPPGQPTKWNPEMNERIVAYFDVPLTRTATKQVLTKDGRREEISEEVAVDLPLFEGFAAENDITTETILNWAKPENAEKYPGFFSAYKKAKQCQKRILVANGLAGRYSTPFAIFTAKNITDMRDQVDQRHVDADGQTVAPVTIKVVRPNE